MHVVITGGTGFVGKHLTASLIQDGHHVSILTRHPENSPDIPGLSHVKWLQDGAQPENTLDEADAIVNLAGESINSGRWTDERKQRIYESRIKATDEVIRILKKLSKKPEVLVNASAVGYYGMSESETFTEKSNVHAEDFLAKVVRSWEQKASQAEKDGVRTVYARFGVILGSEGALQKMILPYKFGVGGTVGSGKQWLSWIHIADVVGLIRFALENRNVNGALNVTSPEPLRMKQAGKTIGEVMNRPHWIPVPKIAMKAALGEMSNLLLHGQRVLPAKAMEQGYAFEYATFKQALQDIVK